MKNKSIALILVLLVICSALVGCDQSNSKSYSKESTSAGERDNTEETVDLEGIESQEESAINSDLRKLSQNKIAIHIGEKVYTVDMYDNPTANDLVSQLPLTLKINDYAGWDEKIIRLRNPLSMEGAPEGDEPEIPEFGYYEPGQWLALYYGYIGYWSGKVPLGRINASVDELGEIPDNASATIEIVRD